MARRRRLSTHSPLAPSELVTPTSARLVDVRRLAIFGFVCLLWGCHRYGGHSSYGQHGVVVGAPHVGFGTQENVHEKRELWFQGLYRDCVQSHYAQACFKTGQNVEDGVVAAPNIDDAHWFYSEACDLQPYDEYCDAADRTAPEEVHFQPGQH